MWAAAVAPAAPAPQPSLPSQFSVRSLGRWHSLRPKVLTPHFPAGVRAVDAWVLGFTAWSHCRLRLSLGPGVSSVDSGREGGGGGVHIDVTRPLSTKEGLRAWLNVQSVAGDRPLGDSFRRGAAGLRQACHRAHCGGAPPRGPGLLSGAVRQAVAGAWLAKAPAVRYKCRGARPLHRGRRMAGPRGGGYLTPCHAFPSRPPPPSPGHRAECHTQGHGVWGQDSAVRQPVTWSAPWVHEAPIPAAWGGPGLSSRKEKGFVQAPVPPTQPNVHRDAWSRHGHDATPQKEC